MPWRNEMAIEHHYPHDWQHRFVGQQCRGFPQPSRPADFDSLPVSVGEFFAVHVTTTDLFGNDFAPGCRRIGCRLAEQGDAVERVSHAGLVMTWFDDAKAQIDVERQNGRVNVEPDWLT